MKSFEIKAISWKSDDFRPTSRGFRNISVADAQDGIKEKCARIRQILLELQIEEEVPEPGLQEVEDPDSVLKVQDKEITVEKWISPEERLDNSRYNRI